MVKNSFSQAVNNFLMGCRRNSSGSWLRCLCCVFLPVSVRQRRSSRLSQRKPWRNSRRKQRKLQRRQRNRPSWSVLLFLFLLCCFTSAAPSDSWQGGDVRVCWALWVQEGMLASGGARLSIVWVFLWFWLCLRSAKQNAIFFYAERTTFLHIKGHIWCKVFVFQSLTVKEAKGAAHFETLGSAKLC